MADQPTITVRALPGRTVPLHRDDHRAGPDPYVLKPGETCEVFNTPGIRRRVRALDLEILTPAKPTASSASSK